MPDQITSEAEKTASSSKARVFFLGKMIIQYMLYLKAMFVK